MNNLILENKSGWNTVDENTKNTIFKFSNEYMEFLNNSKTEREIVKNVEKIALLNDFMDINTVESLKPGDKIYYNNRGKNIYMAIIGSEPIEKGLNIVGSHADSPRLDLKPNPLFQQGNMAFLNTHYYGGIKKYQWTAVPLSLHGVIYKANGEKLEISIGEKDDEPVFTVTDLLPHLDKDQLTKKVSEAINGEKLDVLCGNIPALNEKNEEEKDALKLNILRILNKKYGLIEEDFVSSELEFVPAYKAKTTGFDESMVAGYGQDDKVCVYTSLRAILEVKNPVKTAVCLISDKEEIGSMGNTGMESNVFSTFISEILNKLNVNKPNLLDKVFLNSKMLSADVDAGVDPLYTEVQDLTNAGFVGHGISINKYTGSGGKYNASDANAEYMAIIRNLFNSNNIKYQVCELGKVDIGGGGTIAYILANRGVDVVDCGIPLLSMHSPYEVASKFDIYESFRAYKVFFELN